MPAVLISYTHDFDVTLTPPKYMSEGASGIDIAANLPLEQRINSLDFKSGTTLLIPTGIILEIPKKYEGQIRPGSGLALNKSITVLNTPGTIDSDYRGEIQVLLINLDKIKHKILHGERIAQLAFSPIQNLMFFRTGLKFS